MRISNLLKGVFSVSAKAAPSQAGSDWSQPYAVPAAPGFIGAVIDVDAGVSCLVPSILVLVEVYLEQFLSHHHTEDWSLEFYCPLEFVECTIGLSLLLYSKRVSLVTSDFLSLSIRVFYQSLWNILFQCIL